MHAKLMRSSMLAIVLSLSLEAGATTPGSAASRTAAPDSAAQKSGTAASKASTQVDTAPTAAQLAQSALVVIPPPILRNTGKITLTRDKPLLGHLNLKAHSVQGLLVEAPPALQPTPYEAALSMGTGNTHSLLGP